MVKKANNNHYKKIVLFFFFFLCFFFLFDFIFYYVWKTTKLNKNKQTKKTYVIKTRKPMKKLYICVCVPFSFSLFKQTKISAAIVTTKQKTKYATRDFILIKLVNKK